jgi:hypothetical protein
MDMMHMDLMPGFKVQAYGYDDRYQVSSIWTL